MVISLVSDKLKPNTWVFLDVQSPEQQNVTFKTVNGMVRSLRFDVVE